MKQYLDLVNEVLKRGTRKENRTGVDTISAFNINYSIDLNEGFPLLTTKEISWKTFLSVLWTYLLKYPARTALPIKLHMNLPTVIAVMPFISLVGVVSTMSIPTTFPLLTSR